MLDIIRARLAVLVMIMVASLGLAACDQLAAAPENPTHRFVIQADLAELEAMTDEDTSLDDLLVESTEVISRRVDVTGSRIRSISYTAEGAIVLEVSGPVDGAALAALIGPTGDLAFRMVDPNALPIDVIEGIAPPGSEILPMADESSGTQLAVRRLGGISGDTVVSATAGFDDYSEQPVVYIGFDERGAAQLARLTTEHVGQQMAVVLDDEILMAPVIHEPILGGQLQVAGGFTTESASELAIILSSGMLPTPFTLVEETVIAPAE